MNLASVIQIPVLGDISIELLIIIALSLLCITLLFVVWHAHRRISRILRGKNTLTIEESILELAKELDSLTNFKERAEEYHKDVEERLRKSVQSIETKRFNPFKGTGTGGNQSFASAFINENGDGLILSSLYSSDRMSVFAKPVQNFTSTFELTEEEAEALENAKNKVAF